MESAVKFVKKVYHSITPLPLLQGIEMHRTQKTKLSLFFIIIFFKFHHFPLLTRIVFKSICEKPFEKSLQKIIHRK